VVKVAHGLLLTAVGLDVVNDRHSFKRSLKLLEVHALDVSGVVGYVHDRAIPNSVALL
jgi:hypothetical protein